MAIPFDPSALRSFTQSQTRDAINAAKNATDNERYTDVTRTVMHSEVAIGDKSHNGHKKAHKPNDRLSRYMPDTAYVVSDTTYASLDSDSTVTMRKRGGMPLMRDSQGRVDSALTLAALSIYRTTRASKGRR